MSELGMNAVVQIGDKKVVVSELTPAGARRLLMPRVLPKVEEGEEAFAAYRLDVWMFEECRISDLAVFTNLDAPELEQLPPSELRKLISKAKELNPDFFGALARMAAAQSTS